MDDLLSEFLTETSESLDVVDVELVKFEQEPNNAQILDNIFRLVHTIKGTCGFLGLPRLEALAHAAETLMGKYRDGAPVTGAGVSLILTTIDRIKDVMAELEQNEAEPAGDDNDLIHQLEQMSLGGGDAPAAEEASAAPASGDDDGDPPLVVQELERELKPGEVSLDDLERAFREAPGPEMDDEPEAEAPAEAEAEAEEAAAPEPAKPEPVAAEAAPAPAQEERQARSGNESTVKSQSIRVNVDTLEHLMTMVSELVLTRNQLLEMVRRLNDSEFKVPLQRLSNVTAELQEGVMKTRMQPIGNAWQKLPRIVRDLSLELGKKIDLEMIGADTELDRQVLEMIKDPLTHMVRNSADHGLESTEDRIKAGKPETGKITLSAYHEGGHIIIEIADDGRGLNVDKIKSKVIQNGLATESELETMSPQQIHKYIFAPGFSTAAEVTSVSGRGVGMDVVRTNIELIGGNCDLKSEAGKGSTFIIKIPLTLAIVSALIVEACKQRFAIPQLSVVELVRTHANSEHRIERINDTPVLRLRNKLLPLITLGSLLKLSSDEMAIPESDVPSGDVPTGEDGDGTDVAAAADDQSFFVVVIQVGNQSFGIVVDSVFDTEEIVVKPMSTMLRDITMFSGNTILGDGSVIMIIDPNGIAQEFATQGQPEQDVAEAGLEMAQTTVDKTALLLFRAGSEEPKAVPLSLVTRLEEIDVSKIENTNGQNLVQYRGNLMPLVELSDGARIKSEGSQPILVFTDERHSVGLVVDEIVDIVEERLDVELTSESAGLIGSAVVKGRATAVIDIGHYLGAVMGSWADSAEELALTTNSKLLLVDDSPFFRNMLSPLLSAAGYDVTLTESANEALELKQNGAAFDVIVSDIEMPGMDGIRFAETLQGDPQWGATPLIALSSHSAPQIIERTREAGFFDFVGKFDRQGLMESLKECDRKTGVAA